ncbi:MAG: hypothetical protein MUE72_12630 [Chitinophagaceae bacterium]|jgi:hypothetical protein|nr:hypothetical protein [Chitinophagaceae bacterium]
MLNKKLSLEQQAEHVFEISNNLRKEARELMADRAKANKFDVEEYCKK